VQLQWTTEGLGGQLERTNGNNSSRRERTVQDDAVRSGENSRPGARRHGHQLDVGVGVEDRDDENQGHAHTRLQLQYRSVTTQVHYREL
jgi:hypothetical protein